jgi:ubiquinone/menaquinone biosynthesis C-methylase UbiE
VNESTQIEAAAFDELAQDYDAQFTATSLGRTLRATAWRRFERAFAGREYLLDLGCGTGEDAVHLARLGHRVLATDASSQMVRLARHKAERAGCADRIRFLRLPMEKLGELAGERFDGVYSNFGAINCAADLGALVRDLARVVPARAPLSLVVMGRHVPWEWAWYLARADAATAFRRLRRGGVPWRGLRIRYPTPATLTRAFAPHFTAPRLAPLGVALPGSYAANLLERAPRTLAMLARLEHLMRRRRLLASFADHFSFETTRLES